MEGAGEEGEGWRWAVGGRGWEVEAGGVDVKKDYVFFKKNIKIETAFEKERYRRLKIMLIHGLEATTL